MGEMATRQATYADIEALPPHVTGEILYGHLYTQARPARRHGGAASVLGMLLGNPFQLGRGGPGGWTFVVEPELHLGEHVLVPDIGGWRNASVTEPAEQAHFAVAPDWACEVLSPGTEQRDRGLKRKIFADYGVGHLWFVDPRPRIVEVFELRDSAYSLVDTFSGDVEVSAPPYSELSFDLNLLWPFDKPSNPAA